MNPIIKSGSANTIYPFILLPRYKILVCQVCQFGYLADEVATHLRTRHYNIELHSRRKLLEKIQKLPDVLRSQSQLDKLQYPPPTTEPIACLGEEKTDGLKCQACSLILRQIQKIQAHYAQSYSWVNPRCKGRPLTIDPVPLTELPAGNRWFEVSRNTKRQEKGKSQTKPEYQDAISSDTFAAINILRALTRLPNRQHLTTDYILDQGSHIGKPNLASPHKDEQKILCIVGAFDSVIDRYEDTVRQTSQTLLSWLLSSRLQSRQEIPFSLKQFLTFIFRMHQMASSTQEEPGIRRQAYNSIQQIPTVHASNQSNNHIFNPSGNGERIDEDSQYEEENDDNSDNDIEDWDLEDETYDDNSGYYSDLAGTDKEPQSPPIRRVNNEPARAAYNEFLELLFQLYLTLCTETFINGQLSSTLLVYFSGILRFSGDCRKFLLIRQYCPQLLAIIYIQYILLLECILPLHPYPVLSILQ
ncbi:hypothetical protein EDB80DRAFT_756491 [Ilyonectria destructans]|nr:hypothetical protein EDB80DRAFT_756491 [Ilyonectria destructans]